MARVMQVLIAFDQLINACLSGWADETVSSRAFRCAGLKRRWFWTMRVIDTIFFWQANHCFLAYVAEQQRRQCPPDMRPPPNS